MQVKSSRALLILDLDETLVHSSESELDRPADFRIEEYHCYKRPGLQDFLSNARNDYLVAVWTSSSPDYASAIVENIFPRGYPLEFVWARDRCTYKRDFTTDSYFYAKNLVKAKRRGYSLDRMLIVDNTPAKVSLNYGNVVYIKSWYGDLEDRELTALSSYLGSIREHANYRNLEKRGWRTRVT